MNLETSDSHFKCHQNVLKYQRIYTLQEKRKTINCAEI